MSIRGIKRVLRLRLTRRQIEDEIDEELAYHIARRRDQLQTAGLSSADAMAAAAQRFGNIDEFRQQCLDEDITHGRNESMTQLIDRIRSDTRLAIRSLERSPGFTAVALTTLIVGITAVTTIASFVYSYTLRPLPYPDADRIVAITQRQSATRAASKDLPIDAARAVVSGTAAFDRTTIFRMVYVRAVIGDRGESLPTALIDSSFEPLFGLRPELGRTITPDEIIANAPVVAISDALWRSTFGMDSSVVGRRVRFGDELLTVVGVMPRGFRFPNESHLWRPLGRIDSSDIDVAVIGRLRRGATREAAGHQLAAVGQRLAHDDVRDFSGVALSVGDLIDRRIGGAAPLAFVFVGAAAFVLLIACSNVANLLLVRAAERRAQMAVRSALGASRMQLRIQALVEPALLSIVAGALGAALSFATIRILLHVVPTANFPSWLTFGIDGRMLLVVVIMVTVVVLAVGLTPSREGTRFDLVGALKSGGDHGSANTRVGRAARRGIAIQLALSVVLFIGAALLTQTYRKLSSVDVGYPAAEIVELRPYFDQQHYPNDTTQREFANALLEHARALPGVRQVSLLGIVDRLALATTDLRPSPDTRRSASEQPDLRLIVDGDSSRAGMRTSIRPAPRYLAISDSYFETLGLRIVHGRSLSAMDAAGSQLAVVVSQRFADTYWPRQNALGHSVQFGSRGTRLLVVGVVENVRDLQSGSRGVQADPRADVYLSARQVAARNPSVLIRGQGDVTSLQAGSQAIARRIDPNVVTTTYTLARPLEVQLMVTRLFGALVGVFAVSGLLLSVIGIYGVVAYGITQRTREIGIRVALGGTSADILALILRQSLRFVGIGLVVGVAISLAMSRGLRAILFGVSATDPFTYVVSCVLFGAIAWIACYVPARRALRVDPLVALRAD